MNTFGADTKGDVTDWGEVNLEEKRRADDPEELGRLADCRRGDDRRGLQEGHERHLHPPRGGRYFVHAEAGHVPLAEAVRRVREKLGSVGVMSNEDGQRRR